MVVRVNHDDIELSKPKSQRNYTEFHEDISGFLNALVSMNLVHYSSIKELLHIKPSNYHAHLFCNFHKRVGHAIKECFHLRNIIQYLQDKGKFKFDDEVSNEVL